MFPVNSVLRDSIELYLQEYNHEQESVEISLPRLQIISMDPLLVTDNDKYFMQLHSLKGIIEKECANLGILDDTSECLKIDLLQSRFKIVRLGDSSTCIDIDSKEIKIARSKSKITMREDSCHIIEDDKLQYLFSSTMRHTLHDKIKLTYNIAKVAPVVICSAFFEIRTFRLEAPNSIYLKKNKKKERSPKLKKVKENLLFESATHNLNKRLINTKMDYVLSDSKSSDSSVVIEEPIIMYQGKRSIALLGKRKRKQKVERKRGFRHGTEVIEI